MTETITRRPVGRPRANNKVPDLPARQDILIASAELFGEHGFKGTSTRMIAERVGIRQPSLFHHFSRKADILEALVDAGEARIREFVEEVDFAGDPRHELYTLIFADCRFLLTEPLGINKLLAMPEVRNGPLGEKSDATRAYVINAYRRLIRRGAKQGHFYVPDLELVTQTVFGMGESVWSHKARLTKRPDRTARLIADMALRALLIDIAYLDSLQCSNLEGD